MLPALVDIISSDDDDDDDGDAGGGKGKGKAKVWKAVFLFLFVLKLENIRCFFRVDTVNAFLSRACSPSPLPLPVSCILISDLC